MRPIFSQCTLALALLCGAPGVAIGAAAELADLLAEPGLRLAEPAQRERVVARKRAIDQERMSEAWRRAGELGLPRRRLRADGTLQELAGIEAGRLLYFTTHNANAAISVGANLLQAAPFDLDGAGFTVGVWDGAPPRATHREFDGRVTLVDAGDPITHATHVTGTIAASGFSAPARGMAPAVRIDAYDWNGDKAEMTARAATYPGEPGKLYISNHSYGYVSGWSATGSSSPAWEWWGTGTTASAYAADFGRYGTHARDSDSIAFNAPYYLMFRSAGNDRSNNPAAGQSVTLSAGGTSTVSYDSALHPPGDGVYRGGYDSISFDAVAKNVLTIGAVTDAVSGGSRDIGSAAMPDFSSWGPTDDGRIKPDLVANGSSLLSTLGSGDAAYGNISGTSMATPNAAGAAQLLVSLYDRLFPGHALRASTLRALLIHSADDLGRPGPDYQYGWGLVNVRAAADLLLQYAASPGAATLGEHRLSTAVPERAHSFVWDGVAPIRATLVWNDPPGTATTSHDNRTRRLVNNLDLVIRDPDGTEWQPYSMPFVGAWTQESMTTPAVAGKNNTDNVEQVLLAAPPRAGTYQAVVRADGSLAGGSQIYSLVISGSAAAAAPPPRLDSVAPATGAADAIVLTLAGAGFLPGATVTLRRPGFADHVATGLEILGDSIRCRVHLGALAAGAWNVAVTNPDGADAALSAAFTVLGSLWHEDFEGGAPGWTSAAPVGGSAWALDTAQSQSPVHAMFAPGPATRTLDELYAPPIAIPGDATDLRLTFWHAFDFQNGRDGGVLERAVDDGAWLDIAASGSGAIFAASGYTGNLTAARGQLPANRNPLVNRSAWTGASNGFVQVAVDLDPAVFAGRTLHLRWRLGTDASTASPGWRIDDIVLRGAVATTNLAPTVVNAASAVPELIDGFSTELAVDADDDGGAANLIYQWSVSAGNFRTPVEFSANGTAAANRTTATFSGAGPYTLTVTVRDAEGLVAVSSVDVEVLQTPAAMRVEPATADLVWGEERTFTAIVSDQFGRPLDPAPETSWEADGGGAIYADGLFIATAIGGPFTITARAAGFAAHATVQIERAPALVMLAALTQAYNGQPRPVQALTQPSGLAVAISYDGSPQAPSAIGSYTVQAAITDPRYIGDTSGLLTITGEPLSTWRARWFSTEDVIDGLAADAADPDGDGLPNLAEYALGTTPLQADVNPLRIGHDDQGWQVTFSRPQGLPDVQYFAEASADLLVWTPLELEVVADGNPQTVRLRWPAAPPAGPLFLRLRLER